MKILLITPSAGDGFYCENCLRDLTLVGALRAQGHEVTLVPLYLPLPMESGESATDVPIFFGGVNVYLQQKLGIFRKTPRRLDAFFDNRRLLSLSSKMAGMTNARDLGETTISMLKGEEGRQVKELNRLVDRLVGLPEKPDVVILSNILIGGLAHALKQRIGVPVVCLLQDEMGFVDGLDKMHSDAAWDLLRACCRDISALISVSRAYGNRMAGRLGLDENRIHIQHFGVDVKGYRPAGAPPDHPTIGFLGHMCRERGLETLTEAFILLKRMPGLEACRLRITGGSTLADRLFIKAVRRRLDQAGVAGDFRVDPEFSLEQRRDWLRNLSVMCLPEKEEVAYGMAAMEALSAGVPVVATQIGVFPELIGLTGGGVLVKENSPQSFVDALAPLLLDPEAAQKLGRSGRPGMVAHFDIERTAAEFAAFLGNIVRENKRTEF